MEEILYKSGYKYKLEEAYSTDISIMPDNDIEIPGKYVILSKKGKIVIKENYAWDGPSGPTIDTLNFMRGSLVHDALYQLMRLELLDKDSYRDKADRILQKMCKEDGMSSARAWLVYQGVSLFGESAADPKNKKVVLSSLKPTNIG